MLYTKYESSRPCSFRQEDFWKLHFENLLFDPMTYTCNQSEPFEPTLVGDHPGIIPVKFGQNPMSGFRGEDVLSKKVYARRTTHDWQRPVTIAHPEHFVIRWAKKFKHNNACTTDKDRSQICALKRKKGYLENIDSGIKTWKGTPMMCIFIKPPWTKLKREYVRAILLAVLFFCIYVTSIWKELLFSNLD